MTATRRNAWLRAMLIAASMLPAARHGVAADSPGYPIAVGDVLQITIYAGGEEQEKFTGEVSSTGTITSPLLGDVPVAGLLPNQAAQRLTEILGQGYYVNPKAVLSIKEYAGKVYVIGEVQRPGAYNIHEGLTALNACILAGGFSDYAAPNRAKVIRVRKGQTQVFKINLRKVLQGTKPDMLLQPSDRIEVPHRKF